MKLKIDFHVHSHKSFDSTMTIPQIIEASKKKGLDGVCICDHACTDIYDSINNNNDDFIIIPAVEFTTGSNHIIAMFLEKEPAVEFGDNFRVSVETIVNQAHNCGGICILAHPFERLKEGIDAVSERTDSIMKLMDGMEIYNSRAPYRFSSANLLAGKKADELEILAVTAGSDAHSEDEIGNAYCIVDTPSRSLEDIKQSVLNGKLEVTGHHCKRTAIIKSELIKAHKFKCSFSHKIKCYLKYPIFFLHDLNDKLFGRKL